MKKKAFSIILFMAAMCFALFGQAVNSRAAEGDEIDYKGYEFDYIHYLMDDTMNDISVPVYSDQVFSVGPFSDKKKAKAYAFTPKTTGKYLIRTTGTIDFDNDGPMFQLIGMRQDDDEDDLYARMIARYAEYKNSPGMRYLYINLEAGNNYYILASNLKTTNSFNLVIDTKSSNDSSEIPYIDGFRGGYYSADYYYDVNVINEKATTVIEDKQFTVGPISDTYMAKVFLFTPQKSDFYTIHTTGSIDFDLEGPRFSLFKENREENENFDDEGNEIEGPVTRYERIAQARYKKDPGLRYIDRYLEAGATYAIMATNIDTTNSYDLIIEKRPYIIGDKEISLEDLKNASIMSEGEVTKVDDFEKDPGYSIFSFKPIKTGKYVLHTTGTVDLSANAPKLYLYRSTYDEEEATGRKIACKVASTTRNKSLDGHHLYIDLNMGETYYIIATNQKSDDSYNIMIELELESVYAEDNEDYYWGYALDKVDNVFKLSESDSNTVNNLVKTYDGKCYSYCSFTANVDGYYYIHKDIPEEIIQYNKEHPYSATEDQIFIFTYPQIYRPLNVGQDEYVSLKAGETCYLKYTFSKPIKNYNVSVKKASYITGLEVKEVTPYCVKTESFKENKGIVLVAEYSDGSKKELTINKLGLTVVDGSAIKVIPSDTLKEGEKCKWDIVAGITGIVYYSSEDESYYHIGYQNYNEFDEEEYDTRKLINQTAATECDVDIINKDELLLDSGLPILELDKTYYINSDDKYLFTPLDTTDYKFEYDYGNSYMYEYEMGCLVNDLESGKERYWDNFTCKFEGGHTYLVTFEKNFSSPVALNISKKISKTISDINVINNPKFCKFEESSDENNLLLLEIMYTDGSTEIKQSHFDISWGFDEDNGFVDKYDNSIWLRVTDETYIDQGDRSPEGKYSFKVCWEDGISSKTFFFEYVKSLRDYEFDKIEINKAYQIEALTGKYYKVTANDTGKHLLYFSIDVSRTELYEAETGEWVDYEYPYGENRKIYSLEKGKEYVLYVEADRYDNMDIDGIFILNYFNGETDPAIATNPNAIPADWEGVVNVDNIIEKIEEIPDTVTLKDKETVEKASKTYDRLSDDRFADLDDATKQELLTAKTKLDNAVSKITELENEAVTLANNVITNANALPATSDLALSDKEAVIGAIEAYGQLTEDQINVLDDATQKALTDAKAKLDASQVKIAELETAAEEEIKKAAEEAAQAVVAQIIALPDEITLDNKEAVEKAIEAYNKLTPEQLSLLSEDVKQALEAAKAKLDAAQTRIAELEAAATEEEVARKAAEEAAQAVVAQITALPDEITLDNKEAVEKAIETYNKLTPEQLALLSDDVKQALEVAKAKLDAALAKIADLEMTEEDKQKAKEAAQAVVDLITALPDEITLENKEAVEKAIEAYNKLTSEQIASLDDATKQALEAAKAKLDAAQTKINELEKEEEQKQDQEAAQTTVDAINNINMDDPATIEAARKAYDALTPEQQKLVDPAIVQALVNAEEEHKVDQAAADLVAEAIQNMDVSNPTSVFEAKKAFDKLTERQRRLIDPALVALLKKAVKAASQIFVKFIKITAISNQIAAGKKVQLAAAITPANVTKKKLTWKSGNPKIAKVSQNGLVTIAKKTGGKSVRIAAIATDGSKKYATFTIKIMKGAVSKVTVKGAKKTLAVNKTMKLKAKVKTTKGKANKKIKWISDHPEYATVSSSGKVKALKAGKGKKVKITAMATDGSGKKKVVTFKIK